MNLEPLKDRLQTEEVRTKDDVSIAAKLSKNYHREPYRARELDKIINSDWEHAAELLTDVVKVGKHNYDQRAPVAFLLLTEVNFKKASSAIRSDLNVSCFCTEPFYDIEVAVKWADYRVRRFFEYLGRCNRIIWSVDERDVPLQLQLKKKDYKVLKYHQDVEKILFCK